MHRTLMERVCCVMACVATAILCLVPAKAAPAATACLPVIVGEFGDSPRPRIGSPRRPEVHLKEQGAFCLTEDVRQSKLIDPRTGREMTTGGGDGIVLVGADDVRFDLGGHEMSNHRALGYTLIKHYKYEPGRMHSHMFARTSISNGSLVSPGGRGIAIRLTAAGAYEREGFGTMARIAPGKRPIDVFAETSHLLERLEIQAGKRAIEIDGRNNVVRSNHIIVDGLTAIVAQGPGIIIEDNDIEIRGNLDIFTLHDRKVESLTPFPIRLIQADGAIIRNNRIRFAAAGTFESLPAAIQLVASEGVVVEENWIGGLDAAVQADDASSFAARDNRLVACPEGKARFLPPVEADDRRPAKPACRRTG